MGKSYLIMLLVFLDFLRKRKCVVVKDRLYSTIRDLTKWCIRLGIPPSMVFFLDLTRHDIAHLMVHFLEHRAGMAGVTIDGLIGVIRGIPNWKKSIGERMINFIWHLFVALQTAERPLTDVQRFMLDHHYRLVILNRCKEVMDPDWYMELEMYFEHIYSMPRHREVIEPVLNKLSLPINNAFIRPFLNSNESNFNYSSLMNKNVIILENWNEEYFKNDTCEFMSALTFFKIYEDLLSRSEETDPHPVSIYCEEAHTYLIPEFYMPILTGARKFGAGLKIITQSLEAFFDSEVHMIMGTAATLASFAINSTDAKTLRDEMFVFTGETPKKVNRDLRGVYEVVERYGSGDESLNARNELSQQIEREFILRIKGKKGIKLWTAKTSKLPQIKVSKEEVEAYMRASARHWGTAVEE